MRRVRKLVALLLSLAMVLAMSGMAMADQTLTNGEVGGYTSPDSPTVNDKVIKIEKDLIVYNPDESVIYGPQITYTYTVAAGTQGVSVTDATSDHNPAHSVSTTTLSGVGIQAGADASVKINNVDNTNQGTIVWTNDVLVDADANGAVNAKYLTIDFTNVVFTQPGVYRYSITESASEYISSGVTETKNASDNSPASHVRYLDVYVMRSSTYGTDGSGNESTTNAAHWWRVYGYVCVYNDNVAIVDGDTNHAVKTSGFIGGTSDGTNTIVADEYHTYNLTIKKILSGDATMNSHKFPFDVAWTAGTATGTFQFGVKVSGTATVTSTSGTNLDKVGGADAVGSTDKDGAPSIANGGTIKYIGIPCGTISTVTETNDVLGTTYSVSVEETIGTGAASEVATGTVDYNGTLSYAQSGALTADSDVSIQFTNKLETISPTGLMFRYGPYVLILICGVVLLFLGVKFMRRNKEED